MSERMIDLGEVRHDPGEPDPLPRPPRAVGRPLRCALVLLAALVTLTAGAPAARREVVVLPAPLGAQAMVVEDLFLVIDPAGPQGRQGLLRAYRLPGGEREWQMPLPVQGRYWGMSAHDDLLLVTGYQVFADDGPGPVTIALDRATGGRRWQQQGSALPLPDGSLLLETGDDERGRLLRVVDACCGTVRWQLDLPPGQLDYRPDEASGADRFVYSRPDGRVEVRDLATGAVRASADLWGPADAGQIIAQVIGDLVLTVDRTTATVTAYDLDGFGRRWQIRVDELLYVSNCGPVLCLQGRGAGVVAVDPASGRRLWADTRWGGVWPSGDRLVASVVDSHGAGSDTEQIAVLDPRTGRVLGWWGRWQLALPGTLGDGFVGVRPYPGGGLLVAELHDTDGTVRRLDVLRDAAGECQLGGALLICRRMDGTYGLWPLRR